MPRPLAILCVRVTYDTILRRITIVSPGGQTAPARDLGLVRHWWPEFLSTPPPPERKRPRGSGRDAGRQREVPAAGVRHGRRSSRHRSRLKPPPRKSSAAQFDMVTPSPPLFIRPHFCGRGVDFRHARRGKPRTFTRRSDPVTQALTTSTSTSTPRSIPSPAGMLGRRGPDLLAPFGFERSPSLRSRPPLHGAAPMVAHEPSTSRRVGGDGGFRFHDFSRSSGFRSRRVARRRAHPRSVEAGFAGARCAADERLGPRGDHHLGCDDALRDATSARHGPARNYAGRQQKAPARRPSFRRKFRCRAIHASGEGRYDDAFISRRWQWLR